MKYIILDDYSLKNIKDNDMILEVHKGQFEIFSEIRIGLVNNLISLDMKGNIHLGILAKISILMEYDNIQIIKIEKILSVLDIIKEYIRDNYDKNNYQNPTNRLLIDDNLTISEKELPYYVHLYGNRCKISNSKDGNCSLLSMNGNYNQISFEQVNFLHSSGNNNCFIMRGKNTTSVFTGNMNSILLYMNTSYNRMIVSGNDNYGTVGGQNHIISVTGNDNRIVVLGNKNIISITGSNNTIVNLDDSNNISATCFNRILNDKDYLGEEEWKNNLRIIK